MIFIGWFLLSYLFVSLLLLFVLINRILLRILEEHPEYRGVKKEQFATSQLRILFESRVREVLIRTPVLFFFLYPFCFLYSLLDRDE